MNMRDALDYNQWAHGNVFDSLPHDFIDKYHDGACHPPDTVLFAEAVGSFQQEHDELANDFKLGPRTYAMIEKLYGESTPDSEDIAQAFLDKDARDRIVQYTVAFEAGHGPNPYAAMNLDKEYEGYFDRPRRKGGRRLDPAERAKQPNHQPHRASKYHPSGGFHIGLSYGAWQAAQEPGSLGSLLEYMKDADSQTFNEVFGGMRVASSLITTTTSRGRRTGKFSVRTRKVDGAFLWEEPWIRRFKKAADYEVFRRAQRAWVADQYLDRILPMADEYNMDSEGAIAVLFDIAVQFGVAGLRKRVRLSGVQSGQAFDPDSILRVIRKLPKSHQDRRMSILEDAGQDVRYTW